MGKAVKLLDYLEDVGKKSFPVFMNALRVTHQDGLLEVLQAGVEPDCCRPGDQLLGYCWLFQQGMNSTL